ncbi:MAG: protease complex subunit PrcB family protein [Spirochaetota bacterium]
MHSRIIATSSLISRFARVARRAALVFLLVLALLPVAPPAAAAQGEREEPFETLEEQPRTACPCTAAGNGGRAGDEDAAREELEYRVLSEGANSAQGEALAARADTEAGLAALWERVSQTRLPEPDPPAVSFEDEVVVAVFLGERSTGGYSVEIDAVCRAGPSRTGGAQADEGQADKEEAVHLCYTEYEPAEDAMVTMALTSPYVLVAIERPLGGVIVHPSTETR